jgi:hypothetical protein
MKWIDRIALLPLAIVAGFLAIAPVKPQPHLFEKLGMLFSGTLTRPIDIFDLFLHATPLALLAIKLTRMRSRGGTPADDT